MGISRDTFYRYQELVEEGNIDSLIYKTRRSPNIKNRVDETTEQAVIDYSIDQPAHDQHRTSNELRKKGIFVSGSGVRSIWLRHHAGSRRARYKNLAVHGQIPLRSPTTYYAPDVPVTHSVPSRMTDAPRMQLLHFLRKLRKLLQVALGTTAGLRYPARYSHSSPCTAALENFKKKD